MLRIVVAFCIVLVSISTAKSQNPLPDFSVEELKNGQVRISWINPYGDDCIQLNVQASIDSIRNFKTIFSTESPQLPQNGFVYTKPFEASFFYRIFYVLSGNAFYFTKSRRSGFQVLTAANEEQIDSSRIITIRTVNNVLSQLSYPDFLKFKDSIDMQTRDTLFIINSSEIFLKKYNPFTNYTPSQYVVTNKDGFVQLKLPGAATKKFKIIFFDNYGQKVFTINHISDPDLIIDKTNFEHAGWFNFELYEDDKLKERNKILLQLDF